MQEEIIYIVIEQKLSYFNSFINVYMLWWVSSVVFCGSIIAFMWQQRNDFKNIEKKFWVYFFILLFFLTIIFSGIFGVYSAFKEQQEINNLLLLHNVIDVSINEYTAASVLIINGTTSFVFIGIIWCLLWNHNKKK